MTLETWSIFIKSRKAYRRQKQNGFNNLRVKIVELEDDPNNELKVDSFEETYINTIINIEVLSRYYFSNFSSYSEKSTTTNVIYYPLFVESLMSACDSVRCSIQW